MTDVDDAQPRRSRRWRTALGRPVKVPAPAWVRRAEWPATSDLAGHVGTFTARVLVIVIPAGLAVAGLAIALLAAVLASRDSTEAVGTMGVEIGAAMWFAGAVTLGARPRPTVARALLLTATAIAGMALIATALSSGWTGVGLDLAMEFGVGAVAVVVLDVVILGVLQARLDRAAGSGRGNGQPRSVASRSS